MVAFRAGYDGEIWLEVMLLAGVDGNPVAKVARLAELAARIAPDRIQLNTAVRPPAESFVAPVDRAALEEFAALFTPRAEVIADLPAVAGDGVAAEADVLELVSRRPCTVADIASGLGIHHGEALKAATALVNRRRGRAARPRGPIVLPGGSRRRSGARRGEAMKVAISAQSNDIDSLVDPRFGRARWFIIADSETGEWQAHDNAANVDASGGAGVQAASTVAAQGVRGLITGNVGPNAHKALAAGRHRHLPGRERRHAPATRWTRSGAASSRRSEGPTVSGHWA